MREALRYRTRSDQSISFHMWLSDRYRRIKTLTKKGWSI